MSISLKMLLFQSIAIVWAGQLESYYCDVGAAFQWLLSLGSLYLFWLLSYLALATFVTHQNFLELLSQNLFAACSAELMYLEFLLALFVLYCFNFELQQAQQTLVHVFLDQCQRKY
jgi:hypothetical protein